jgi:hypothetical protein
MADGTVRVGFELPAAVSASTVSVCGEFNGWQTHTHQLDALGDGSFRTEITLPAGERLRFRYLLDGGRWENDWAADDYVPNGLGDDDSVVDLTNPQGLPLLAAPDADGAADEGTLVRPATGDPSAAVAPGIPSGGEDVEVHGEAEDGAPTRPPHLLRRWWRRLTRRGSAGAPTDDPTRAIGVASSA